MAKSKEFLVNILLASYHGRHYICEQIVSIFSQSHKNIHLWISQDSINDGTKKIVDKEFSKKHSNSYTFLQGPGQGFASNFMSLINNEEIQGDFFAFSDQDDIWNVDKIERAITVLEELPDHIPALYCSRTQLVDDNNQEIGFSPLFKKKPSFSNALVQSIAGGNTMVMNKAARDIVKEVSKGQNIFSHDWWVYLVITAVGGKVFYDATPRIRYRQHHSNIVGNNQGFLQRVQRICYLLQGRFRVWNDQNITALGKLYPKMTDENKKIYEQFSRARQGWLIPRVIGMIKSGVYRQTRLGNIGLAVAVLLKKV